jgi:hypothetical protein
MKWLEALKQWNAQHGGKWVIPKKGSPEHAEVKAIQEQETPEESPYEASEGHLTDVSEEEKPKKKKSSK